MSRKKAERESKAAGAMAHYGNCGRGVHDGALAAARSVYAVREQLAGLFGCPRADHVAFTMNSTMALNIAVSGLLGSGDHVISTDLEHNSVLRPLYRLRQQGGAADFVPAGRDGAIGDHDAVQLSNAHQLRCQVDCKAKRLAWKSGILR